MHANVPIAILYVRSVLIGMGLGRLRVCCNNLLSTGACMSREANFAILAFFHVGSNTITNNEAFFLEWMQMYNQPFQPQCEYALFSYVRAPKHVLLLVHFYFDV